MNELTLALTLAYIFFTALLLLIIIYSRIHFVVKIGILLLSIGFYVMTYEGWRLVQGWPARVDLPQKFLLHFVVIEEPDEELKTDGNIFIWLTDLYGEEPSDMPRAYHLPYERGLHGKLNEAMHQQRNGNIQIGEFKAKPKRAQQGEKIKKLGLKHEELTFVNLPDPSLPEK